MPPERSPRAVAYVRESTEEQGHGCERCGARMHGACGSRPPVRRYLCSTRRHGDGCDQPITRAEPLEEQLVEWISDFRPDEELRATILASIRTAARESNDDSLRRRELVGQLERLRDLYVMGDLSKSEYVLRRQALEDELSRPRPPVRSEARESGRASRRLRPHLDARGRPGEAASAARDAPRSRLARRRHDRGREAAGSLLALLPDSRRTGSSPRKEARCQKRERRDSNPRPPA
jgi:Recombinase zinc beta ribbon domain